MERLRENRSENRGVSEVAPVLELTTCYQSFQYSIDSPRELPHLAEIGGKHEIAIGRCRERCSFEWPMGATGVSPVRVWFLTDVFDLTLRRDLMRSKNWFLCAAVAAACSATTLGQDCGAPIVAVEGANLIDTTSQTADIDLTGICDPGPFGTDSIYNVAYYSFVSTLDGDWTLSTCNIADFDTRIAVMSVCGDVTTTIVCLDDTAGCANFTTTLVLPGTVAGTTYYIAVGGYSNADFGTGTLQITSGGGGGGGGGTGCGSDNPQDCCVAGSTPGCNDETCCTTVCAADAYCCDTQWDQICADEAAGLCKICGATPCVPDFTVCNVFEGEDCGLDFNGGCNSPAPIYGTIAVGDKLCGNMWADANVRDTDWFLLTSPGRYVTFSLTSAVPSYLFVADYACPPGIVASNTLGGCPVVVPSVCLPAGDWVVIALPSLFGGFPCPGGDYVLEVTDDGLDCTGPENDECDGALEILEGVTPFDTNGAFTGTVIPESCDEGFGVGFAKTLWYTFTPSTSGIWTFSTCNTCDYDSRLAIFTDDCLAMQIVACNDDGAGCGLTSSMNAQLEAGIPYRLAIGGFDGGGTGTISIAPFVSCPMDCSSSATELEACGSDTNGGCNDPSGANATESIALNGSVCGTFWADGGTRDTDWYSFNLAADATVNLTVNASLTVTIGLLDGNCPPAIFAIDGAQSCGAFLEGCLPAGNCVAFVALGSFTGTPCGSGDLNNYQAILSELAPCDAPSCGEGTNDCCVAQVTPYCSDATCCSAVCAADAYCCDTEWDQICADAALATCEVCGAGPPPANDECVGAIEILNGDTAFDTTTATGVELTACAEFGGNIHNNLWYTYVATQNGTLTVSTCNTATYDTKIAFFSGDCSALVYLACDDDGPGCANLTSSMSVSVTQGQSYYLLLGGYSAASRGTGTVNLSYGGGGGGGPANDLCVNAQALAVGFTNFSTIGASGTSVTACAEFGGNIYNDIWYTYSPEYDGIAKFSLCPANGGSAAYDSKVAIFSGNCSALAYITCDDDTCGLSSEVSWDVECGTTYYITLGAYGATGFGTGVIALLQDGSACSPPGDPADLNGDGVVDAADLSILLNCWGQACADLNGDGGTDAADLSILLNSWTV